MIKVKLPLDGTNVLDLTRLLPGPYLTMLLGDYGADVLKIEDPIVGDYVRWRPPYIKNKNKTKKINALFTYLNRNKKSLTLNLKKKEGLKIFYRLVETADIIVESFRPIVKEKLKIDYETVKEINPTIIYVSLTGFGQNGPLKKVAGHDLNYISLTGILGLTGKKDEVSSIPGTQIGDIGVGGYMGFGSVLLALLAKEKYNIGQFIDLSIYDGLLSWLPLAFSSYFLDGEVPHKEERRLNGLLPWYNVYKTKDGKEITLAALEFKFWKNFCKLIDRKDLIKKHEADPEKYSEIKETLSNIFTQKTRDQWVELVRGIDCCLAPVLLIDEVMEHPHFKERKPTIKYNHKLVGTVRQIGFSFNLSNTPGKLRLGAPSYGEHNIEILKSLGYNSDQIEYFMKEKIIGSKRK
ncbi:MAG: CoA transferase [Candidatus Lokiarchaeota archaeon]|nr:CoA transferase [Candidatus Lokiarchaeota archaeon]